MGCPNSPLISESPTFHITGVDEVTSGTLGTSLLPRSVDAGAERGALASVSPGKQSRDMAPPLAPRLQPSGPGKPAPHLGCHLLGSFPWGAVTLRCEVCGWPGKEHELTSGEALGAGPCLSTHGWVTWASQSLWAFPPLKKL